MCCLIVVKQCLLCVLMASAFCFYVGCRSLFHEGHNHFLPYTFLYMRTWRLPLPMKMATMDLLLSSCWQWLQVSVWCMSLCVVWVVCLSVSRCSSCLSLYTCQCYQDQATGGCHRPRPHVPSHLYYYPIEPQPTTSITVNSNSQPLAIPEKV